MAILIQCKKCGKEFEIPMMPGAFLMSNGICPKCREKMNATNKEKDH